MNRLPHALVQANGDLFIDIFTRLQNNDPHASTPIKLLDDDPQVRLIRLPCGPTDRYLPKEMLYGGPIGEFVEHILAFAEREGVRYDLLHGHYADGWEAVTSLQQRWPHQPPTLLSTHSLARRKRSDALERGEGTVEELDRRYNFPARINSEERSLKAANRILPLSTPEARILALSYGAVPQDDPRLTVLPNGIDPSSFPPPSAGAWRQLRGELGVQDDTFLLLVPSRVDPRKGQANLLRALDMVREHLLEHDLRVLFVAWPDPPTAYAKHLESIFAAAGLSQWVITHPPIPHEDMAAFFAAADGVALPSQEYFSIAMLEAMLMERPLIASVHSSGVDVISSGVQGFLVDHNDPRALGEAVVQLLELSPAARQQMGLRARERVLTGYTWDRVAQRLFRIYGEVL
jgi:glycosyltransferase involved in cell wall biosynthesis